MAISMTTKLTQKQLDENYKQLIRSRRHEKKLNQWAQTFPFNPLKEKITGKDWKAYKKARKEALDQLKSLNSVKRGL